jgi:hypothetical protein
MLPLPKWPLCTRNWQIFTLKFWNTWPTHLIWHLWTTISFLTSRNVSSTEATLAVDGWIAAQPIFWGWVIETVAGCFLYEAKYLSASPLPNSYTFSYKDWTPPPPPSTS